MSVSQFVCCLLSVVLSATDSREEASLTDCYTDKLACVGASSRVVLCRAERRQQYIPSLLVNY